jgi:hypothetical protein
MYGVVNGGPFDISDKPGVGLVLVQAAQYGRVSPRMRMLLRGRYCQAILRELGIADQSRGSVEDARLLERSLLSEKGEQGASVESVVDYRAVGGRGGTGRSGTGRV